MSVICNLEKKPNYIDEMLVSETVKTSLRDKHYTLVQALENIRFEGRKALTAIPAKKSGKVFLTLGYGVGTDKYNDVVEKIGEINKNEGHKVIGIVPMEINGQYKYAVGVDVTPLAGIYNNSYMNELNRQSIETEAQELLNEDLFRAELETDEEIQEIYKNKNDKTYVKYRMNQDLREKMIDFLSKVGFTVEQTDEIIEKYGANGLTNMVKKTVQFAMGKDVVLPEEVAHVFVEMLPKGHPLYMEMMNAIEADPIFAVTYNEYKDDAYYQDANGNPDIEKIKKEAVGQVIAEEIYRINNNKPATVIGNWLSQLLNWIKSIFTNKMNEDSSFALAANKILEGNITDLTESDFTLEQEAFGIFKNRKTDYRMVQEDLSVINEKKKLASSLKNAVAKIRKFRKNALKNDIEARKTFSDIEKGLSSLKLSENDEEKLIEEVAVNFTDTMIEVNALYKGYMDKMKNIIDIPDPDIKLSELSELMSSIILSNRVLEDLQNINILLDDTNPVKAYMANIFGNKAQLENLFRRVAIDSLQKVFADQIYGQDYIELKEKTQAQVDQLEEKKKIPGAPIEFIDSEITRLWNNFNKVAPSEEKIKSLLEGTAGDIDFFALNLQKAIASNNHLISGLQKKFEEAMFENMKVLMATANDIDTAHAEYVRQMGVGVNNDEALYDPITTVVEKTIRFDKDGKPVTTKKVFFLSKHDPIYKVQIDELRMKKRRVRTLQSETTDPVEYAKLEKELMELNEESKKLYSKLQRQYTDKYYKKLDDLLDEKLTDNQGNEFTVREETKDVYERRSKTERDIQLAESVDKMIFADAALQDILFEIKEMKSLYNKIPGTKEYMIAERMKLYDKNKKEIVNYKRTSQTDERFKAMLKTMQRMLDSGKMTQEQFDIWKKNNTQRRFTDTYWAERKKILDEMNSLMNLYVTKDETLAKDISKLYEDLEDISKKYRDENGIINGNELTDQEILDVKKIEDGIQELKNKMEKLGSISVAEREELRELKKKKIEGIADDAEKAKVNERISEIEAKKKEMKGFVNPDHIDEYYALLDQLASLTKTENTTYYEERKKEELAKHAATVDISSMDDLGAVNIKGQIYTKGIDGWTDESGNTFSDITIEEAYRFELAEKTFPQSEWFKNNHTSSRKWVKNPKFDPTEAAEGTNLPGRYETVHNPLYVWRYTEPSNDIYIEEEAPAFKYFERVVKPEYENTDYKDIDGYPLPKPGEFIDQKYAALEKANDSKSKAQLKYLNLILGKYLDAQKFIEDEYERPGRELPTMEKGFFETINNPFSKEGIIQMGNYIGKGVKRTFKITEQDKEHSYGDVLSEEDVILKGMPVYFTSDLDLDLQLRDATKLVMAFTAMAVKRHGVNKTKPMANVLLKLSYETDIKDPNIKNNLGILNKVVRRGSQSNNTTRIKELMESIYFGKNKKAAVVDTPFGKFDLNKVVDKLLSISSTQVLGFKTTANIKNNLSGKFQIVLSSITDKNVVAPVNVGKAQMYVSAHIKDLIIDTTKAGNRSFIGQLADYFDFMQGEAIGDYGEKIDWSVVRSVTDLRGIAMGIKNFAEMEQQYMLGVAILMTQMVERNGKMVPMIEAYELKDGLLQPKDGVVVDKRKEMRVRSMIKEINARSNGNINKVDAAVFEKYALGRMVFHMNKFIIPATHYRIGSTRHNVQTNEIEYPIYAEAVRGLYNILKDHGWNPLSIKKYYKFQAEPTKTAQKAVAIETGTVALLGLMLLLAGGYDPDRHKKLKEDTAYEYFHAQLLVLLLSTKTEVETLTPFFGADNILQKWSSPFVAVSTLKLMRRMMVDAFTLKEFKRDEGVFEKGDLKITADVLKYLGLLGGYEELVSPRTTFKKREQASKLGT
jgi:hypothetical protein